MPLEAQLILDAHAQLGEGSLWYAPNNVLYWVNITGKELHVYDPTANTDQVHPLPDDVGTVVPRQGYPHQVVLALGRGFAIYDLSTRQLETLATTTDPTTNRMNDGKCDPAGRFWAGTMAYKVTGGEGSLFRLNPDRSLHTMLTNVTVSNGIVWTANTMYYIDTRTGRVDAFDYDPPTGNIQNRRPAINVTEQVGQGNGSPDGMALDADGMLWVALWGGSVVARVNPQTGKLLEKVTVPGVKQVSSCAFGGQDLQDLYITTAAQRLTDEQKKEQPHAGGLFRVRINHTRGLPAYEYAG